MKTFFAFMFFLLIMPGAQAQSVFSDVPDNHWAAAAVGKLAAAGIIEGSPAEPSTHSASSEKAKKLVRDPSRLTPMIKTAFVNTPALTGSRIDVDTTTKSVTLSGTVTSAAQKNLAGRIARDIAESYPVINKIKITQPKAKAR